jgi:hypothetical protein
MFRACRPHCGAAIVCIALFLVPFAIDLTAGRGSNLVRILEFESFEHSHKPWWRSLIYFCGYFGYVKKPEAFLTSPAADRAAVLGEQMGAYVAWAAVIAIVVAYSYRAWRDRASPVRRFILSLTGITLLAFVLSLYWGVKQIGPMYEYNGYFFYAILGSIVILFCAAATSIAWPKPKWIRAILAVATAVVVWQRQAAPLAIDYSTKLIPPAVQAALAADPAPTAAKYLVFNRGDWGEAVSIGLALAREGHRFLADADWGPKFAPDAGFEPSPPAFDLEGISTWRLTRLGPTDSGKLIRDNLRVYFSPLFFDPTHATIDCGENGNLELYSLFGLSSPSHATAWSIRPNAGLVFDSPPVSHDVSITFAATPFDPGNGSPAQPMIVSINGHEVADTTLRKSGTFTFTAPASVWNAKRPVLIVMNFPRSISTYELGLSLDHRKFGWEIEWIDFVSPR